MLALEQEGKVTLAPHTPSLNGDMGSAQLCVMEGPAMAGGHLVYPLLGHPLRAKPNNIFIFPQNVQINAFYGISDTQFLSCINLLCAAQSTHYTKKARP